MMNKMQHISVDLNLFYVAKFNKSDAFLIRQNTQSDQV